MCILLFCSRFIMFMRENGSPLCAQTAFTNFVQLLESRNISFCLLFNRFAVGITSIVYIVGGSELAEIIGEWSSWNGILRVHEETRTSLYQRGFDCLLFISSYLFVFFYHISVPGRFCRVALYKFYLYLYLDEHFACKNRAMRSCHDYLTKQDVNG